MPSIFVTGAGKGIGRAVVERFAADGWETLGITRSDADVAALNNLPGGRARFRAADAADAAAVAAVVAELVGDGGLDLLVNNAGGFRYGGFREAAAEDLEAMWRANVLSAFTATRALLAALLRARPNRQNRLGRGA